MEWFEKRILYTKSVAVNSMVGHIIGIGDRHSMNILIDKNTSELIHIDFGVTFEQGKVLRTPEEIPFRLTRDIVDGMGIMGVEGIYRICCEYVLSLLREKSELIMTIVEVLIHDPLFNWTIKPEKMNNLQREEEEDKLYTNTNASGEDAYNRPCNNNNSNNKNKSIDSSRVLIQTQMKLKGVETADGECLSVKGQVTHLIMEAQNINHLAMLFPGWGSWV